MRLALLLASLAATLHQAQPQRSWWAGGARRRRHHSEQGDRRELRTHRYGLQGKEGHRFNSRGQGEDSRVSSLQRRRLQQSEQRHHDTGYRDTGYRGYRGYYPTPAPANTSHLLEATEEYKVETRNGDTVIQFARSGDTQGGFLHLEHLIVSSLFMSIVPTNIGNEIMPFYKYLDDKTIQGTLVRVFAILIVIATRRVVTVT